MSATARFIVTCPEHPGKHLVTASDEALPTVRTASEPPPSDERLLDLFRTHFKQDCVLVQQLSLNSFHVAINTPAIDGFSWAPCNPSDSPNEDAPRAPWYTDSWVSTVHDRLRCVGVDAMSIRQVRHWALSSVLRVITHDHRVLYVKTPLPDSAEIRHTAFVHSQVPHLVPLVHVVPGYPELLVMEAISGAPPTYNSYAELGGHIARLHAALSERYVGAPALDQCQKIESSNLHGAIRSALKSSTMTCLPATTQDRIETCLQRTQGVLDNLEQLDLPRSLLHGDLHRGNLRFDSEGLKVFDWSHPISGISALDVAPLLLAAPTKARRAFVDGYIESHCSSAQEQLRDTWLSIMVASAMLQLLTYLELSVALRSDAYMVVGNVPAWLDFIEELL